MSRTSRVPYHQNVYDLLQVETCPLLDGLETIREWEERTGNCFPVAMREWYASEGEMRCSGELAQCWRTTLVNLWTEFSNKEEAHPLEDLFGAQNRPEQEWRAPRGYRPEVYPHPFFRLIQENQGNWVLFAYVDGSADPPVFSSAGSGGPWDEWNREPPTEDGWLEIGRFADVLFKWFASYYIEADFVPQSFLDEPSFTLRPDAPPKPYRNGLWLRSPDEPFQPPVIDFLIDQFGEPDRTPRPDEVTTYTWRPDGDTIRVTADDPALSGGLSAWWVHAEAAERLAEFTSLLLPWGTLRQTLRADTDLAREVLKHVRGV